MQVAKAKSILVTTGNAGLVAALKRQAESSGSCNGIGTQRTVADIANAVRSQTLRKRVSQSTMVTVLFGSSERS